MTPKLQIQGSKAPEELCLALRQDQREAGSGGSSSLTLPLPASMAGCLQQGFPKNLGLTNTFPSKGEENLASCHRNVPQPCPSLGAIPR